MKYRLLGMMCLLLASFQSTEATAWDLDYDERVAIERAAKKIYEADQNKRREAELRYSTSYSSDEPTSIWTYIIIFGIPAFGIYRWWQRGKVESSKRMSLRDACFSSGIPSDNDIVFDKDCNKAIAINSADKTMLYATIPPNSSSASEVAIETFSHADLLNVQLEKNTKDSSVKISVNTRSLDTPLVEVLLHTLFEASAKQFHAKLLALMHQA